MTALEMLDDDTYIGAENHFNLFTCRKVMCYYYYYYYYYYNSNI
jgi:hypothetical protein